MLWRDTRSIRDSPQKRSILTFSPLADGCACCDYQLAMRRLC
jgi:hypothetical protein